MSPFNVRPASDYYSTSTEGYFKISMAKDFISEALHELAERVKGMELSRYVNMAPQLQFLVPYFKLKTFKDLLPQLVNEYNGESVYEVALFP